MSHTLISSSSDPVKTSECALGRAKDVKGRIDLTYELWGMVSAEAFVKG